jgi:hypothetical protein
MYTKAETRYHNDPNFQTLVDFMVNHLRTNEYTPTEMREAVVLACTIREMERPPRAYFNSEKEK